MLPAPRTSPSPEDALAAALAAIPTPAPDAAALAEAEADLRVALADRDTGLRLVQATTGLGKTHVLAEIAATGGEWWTVVTATHQLVDGQVDEWIAAGAEPAEIMHHQGRRAPTEEEMEQYAAAIEARQADLVHTADGVCLQLDGIQTVAGQRHSPAATLCTSCPNGRLSMVQVVLSQKRYGRADEIRRELEADGVDPATTIPCGAIPQFNAERTTRLLGIAGTAISPTQLEAPKGHARREVYDEISDLASPVTVSRRAIGEWESQWTSRLAWMLERMDLATGEDVAVWRERIDVHEAMINEATPVLDRLSAGLSGGRYTPDRTVMAKIAIELGVIAAAHKARPGTAAWERVRAEWDRTVLDELEAPLRAASDLARAAELGTLEIEQVRRHESVSYRLVGWVPNAAGQDIVDRAGSDEPTYLLDATPSRGTISAVQALGGRIERVIVPQPVRVVVDASHMMGRGARRAQARRAQWVVPLIAERRNALAAVLGCKPEAIPILTHKTWAQACIAAGMGGDIGWWGADDKGHNLWRDAPGLLIVGPPTLPPAALRDAYSADRAFALAAGCAPEDWPVWNEEAELGIGWQIPMGDELVTWPGQLPVDEHLRTWVLDRYARLMAQAIGRLRAVRRESAPTVLMLGPCPDLSEHGITVTPLRGSEPLALAPSATERGQARQAEAELRVVSTLGDLGPEAPEKAIRAHLIAATGRGVHHRVVRRVRDALAKGTTLAQLRGSRIADLTAARGRGVVHKLRRDLPTGVRNALDAVAHRLHRAERGGVPTPVPVALPRRKVATGTATANAPPAA